MATLLQLKSWWLSLDEEWKNLLADAVEAHSSPNDSELIAIYNLKSIFTNVPSEFEEDIVPYKLTSLQPLAMLSNLEDITIQGDVESIKSLEPLRNLLKLKHISICGTQVCDLSPVSNLVNLESLSFNNCPVSDLSPLSRLYNLKTIMGIGSKIRSFSPIFELPQLTNVDFWGDEINMDSLEKFEARNTSCQVNVLRQSMEMAKMLNSEEGEAFFDEAHKWQYDEAPIEIQDEMDQMKDLIVSILEEEIPNEIGCDDLDNYRIRLNIDDEDYFIIFDYVSGQVIPFLISNDRWQYVVTA